MIEDSFNQRKIQIQQAARGCVSGTLAEWPHLLSALRYFGKRANPTTLAFAASCMAREVCEEQGWSYDH